MTRNRGNARGLPLCLALLSAVVPPPASAAADVPAYPIRPVRIIVPFTPSGSTDLYARTLSPKLAEVLSQQVVVDNRAGAGGALGAELAAKATPDGYTIWIGQTANMAIGPALRKKKPLRSGARLRADHAGAESLLRVRRERKLADSVAERSDRAAKKNPQGTTYGSAGIGTAGHINGYLLNVATGIDMTHVPYKGASPAMLDLQGGRISVLATLIGSSAGLIKQARSGRSAPLAQSARLRCRTFPPRPSRVSKAST